MTSLEDVNSELEKITTKIDKLGEDLERFKGSKLEDDYYTIDTNITAYMAELDKIQYPKEAVDSDKCRERRRELLIRLNNYSDVFDEKCEKATPDLTEEEIAGKNRELNQSKEELEKVMACYKQKSSHEMDEILLRIFETVNNMTTKRVDEVEVVKKEVLNKVKIAMYTVANYYEHGAQTNNDDQTAEPNEGEESTLEVSATPDDDTSNEKQTKINEIEVEAKEDAEVDTNTPPTNETDINKGNADLCLSEEPSESSKQTTEQENEVEDEKIKHDDKENHQAEENGTTKSVNDDTVANGDEDHRKSIIIEDNVDSKTDLSVDFDQNLTKNDDTNTVNIEIKKEKVKETLVLQRINQFEPKPTKEEVDNPTETSDEKPQSRVQEMVEKFNRLSNVTDSFKDFIKKRDIKPENKPLLDVINLIKGVNEINVNEILETIMKLNLAMRNEKSDDNKSVIMELYKCLFEFIPNDAKFVKLRTSVQSLINTIKS